MTEYIPADGFPSGSGDPAVRYRLDDGERPSAGVVAALSRATGTATTEMDPLGRQIDLDALDDLLASTDGDGAGRSVGFTAEGYHVEVTVDEVVLWEAGDHSREDHR